MAKNIDEDVNVNGNVRVDGQTTVTGNVAMHNDLLVSGNTTIGGKTTMRGAVTMDGAVKIKGWLDVENLNFPSVGIFPTEEALSAAETPVKGRIAGVMAMEESVSSNSSSRSTSTDPVTTLIPDVYLYYGNGELWVNSGRTIPIHIYLNMTSEIVDADALDAWQRQVNQTLTEKANLEDMSIDSVTGYTDRKKVTLKPGTAEQGSNGIFLTPDALDNIFTKPSSATPNNHLAMFNASGDIVDSEKSVNDIVSKVPEPYDVDDIVTVAANGLIQSSGLSIYKVSRKPDISQGQATDGKVAVWSEDAGGDWDLSTKTISEIETETQNAAYNAVMGSQRFTTTEKYAVRPSAFFYDILANLDSGDVVVNDEEPFEDENYSPKTKLYYVDNLHTFLYKEDNTTNYHKLFANWECYKILSGEIREDRVFINANLGTIWYKGESGLAPLTVPNLGIDGDSSDNTKKVLQLKEDLTQTIVVEHQDISGKANKSEMDVSTSSGTTTITLKTGTSAQLYSKAKVDEMIADAVADATGRAVGEAVRCTYNITTAGTYRLYNKTNNNDGDLKLIVIDGVGYRNARNIQLSTGTVEVLYVFKDATKIPEDAFFKFNGGSAHVPNLTALHLPSFIREIGANAFNGCSNLKAIDCEAMTPPTIGSSAFDAAGISGGTLTVHRLVATDYTGPNWAGAGTVDSY